MLLDICRSIVVRAALALRKSDDEVAGRVHAARESIDRKLDILSEQLSVFNSRLDFLERSAAVKDATASRSNFNYSSSSQHRRHLSSRDFQRSAFAYRRSSMPAGAPIFSYALAKMSLEEHTATGAVSAPASPHLVPDELPFDGSSNYDDSDTSTTMSSSVPSTPMTPYSGPSYMCRKVKRKSTGLKPLILPAILAMDGSIDQTEVEEQAHVPPMVFDNAEGNQCTSPVSLVKDGLDRTIGRRAFEKRLGLCIEVLPTILSNRDFAEASNQAAAENGEDVF